MTESFYTYLPDRAVVTVSGDDPRGFLQGLVTQDMALLDTQPLVYGAMLTPIGKFDCDFFASLEGDAVVLECEAGRADYLAKKLGMYKLRREIDIQTSPAQVLALWGDENTLKAFPYPRDPRHSSLGLRKMLAKGVEMPAIKGAEEAVFDFYDKLRLGLGMPDGSRDFAAGDDTVADMDLEKLNGVSFDKGCYMGQELTSRMHIRGLSKKGLYAVAIAGDPLPPFTDIMVDGNFIGEMRSSNGGLGLAMLRHDSVAMAAKAGLTPKIA